MNVFFLIGASGRSGAAAETRGRGVTLPAEAATATRPSRHFSLSRSFTAGNLPCKHQLTDLSTLTLPGKARGWSLKTLPWAPSLRMRTLLLLFFFFIIIIIHIEARTASERICPLPCMWEEVEAKTQAFGYSRTFTEFEIRVLPAPLGAGGMA